MSSANYSYLQMASIFPTVSGKHTPFCRRNCDLSHHDLVAALFMDGRCAISRIERSGHLPTAMKQAIDSAKLSGWDQNCFIPDPSEPLRCPLLFLACAFGKQAVVEGLLRSSFSPRVLNQDGETALHFAVKNFHLIKTTAQFGRQERKEAFEKVVNILTDFDPNIIALKDKNGRTALHTSAFNVFSTRSVRKMDFYQFCIKHMIKRLVELEDSSAFTRKEVMDIIKAPEDHNGDSVLHILARNTAYFEVLKFAQELLFRGKLPDDKNGQDKTILSIAWATDPRAAGKFFTTLPSINGEQEPGRSEESKRGEENLVSNDNQTSTDVADNSEDCTKAATENPAQKMAAPEFESEDYQPLYVLTNSDAREPYIDQVFSLSCEECDLHGEKCSCSKNSGDVIASLKAQVFSMSSEERAASGRKSNSSENPEDAVIPTKVEIKVESCMEANPTSSSEHCDKASDANNSFLEFVMTEGLGLHAQAKKNIVGVVMAEYSNKLSQVEMALSQKKETEITLEEELALMEKEILAKQRCLDDLRQQSEMLCMEKTTLKRKVLHCEEIQQQLEKDTGNLKKVRSE